VHATTSKYPTDVGEGCFAWSHAGKAADALIMKRKGERLLVKLSLVYAAEA